MHMLSSKLLKNSCKNIFIRSPKIEMLEILKNENLK